MSRPQRFSQKEEFWTTPEMCGRLDRLTASGLLARADHHRLAMNWYLSQNGFPPLPAPPQANGHPHQEVSRHGI